MSLNISKYMYIINDIIQRLIFTHSTGSYFHLGKSNINIYSIINWFAEHGIKFKIIDCRTIITLELIECSNISYKLFTHTNSLVNRMSKSEHVERLQHCINNSYPIKYISTQYIDLHTIQYIEQILEEYGMITNTDQYITITGFNIDSFPKFTLNNIDNNELIENIIYYMKFGDIITSIPKSNCSFLEIIENIIHYHMIKILCRWVLSYNITYIFQPSIISTILQDIGIKIDPKTSVILYITDQNFVLDNLVITDYVDNIRSLVIDRIEYDFEKYIQTCEKYYLNLYGDIKNPILIKFIELIKSTWGDDIYITRPYNYFHIKKRTTYVKLHDDIIFS